MIKKIIRLTIVALTVYSCLPDGSQTYVIPTIPEEFYSSWSLAMRCTQSTTNLVVISFDSTNTQSFKAEGDGVDYDGNSLRVVFQGYYDIPTDSLHFSISTFNKENSELARTDSCSILFSQYGGGYINLLNTYMNPDKIGCKVAAQLTFTANTKSCGFDNENYFCPR